MDRLHYFSTFLGERKYVRLQWAKGKRENVSISNPFSQVKKGKNGFHPENRACYVQRIREFNKVNW